MTPNTKDPIRRIPHDGPRIETGPLQVGEDWPGVFIRGDSAGYYGMLLGFLLKGEADPMTSGQLRGLHRALTGCIVGPAADNIPELPDSSLDLEAVHDVLAFALEAEMSDISEDRYCAGWMSGLEFALWEACHDRTDEYNLTATEKTRLLTLSRLAGGWHVHREFIPMAEWLAIVEKRKESK